MRELSVGLLCFATGRYSIYLEGLAGTARRHLCAGRLSLVTFTDVLPSPEVADVRLYVPHSQWPFGTLYRYRWITDYAEVLSQFDYLFMCDVDMLFVGHVGTEILHPLVATLHAGHLKKRWQDLPFCDNHKSTAFIKRRFGLQYHAGGFQGGERVVYLAACREMAGRIDLDYSKRKYIAAWHDETHWNSYLADHSHVSLPPQYCWGEPEGQRWDTKILALDKEHAAFRTGTSK